MFLLLLGLRARSGCCAEAGARFEDDRCSCCWRCGLAGTSAAATYYVTVAGLGGTPEYETQFAKWAAELDRCVARERARMRMWRRWRELRPRAQHLRADAGAHWRRRFSPTMTFALLLIGHGTFDGTDYKFNLPGPDITAAELASLLNRIPAERQLVVNMTSASGASFLALCEEGPDRDHGDEIRERKECDGICALLDRCAARSGGGYG